MGFWETVNKGKLTYAPGAKKALEEKKNTIVNAPTQQRADVDFWASADPSSFGNDIGPVTKKTAGGDIAPTSSGLKFFKKSKLFDDGYDFGDVTKTILGTAGDAGLNIVKGLGSLGEGVMDLVQYGVGGAADLFGDEVLAEGFKSAAKRNLVEEATRKADAFLDKSSVLGSTTDSILQGIGQVGGIVGLGALGAGAGLSSAGVTALTTGTIGLSGAGSGMGEAYQGGATDGEALAYGVISGASDALTELLFGGLGKAVNAVGLSKGIGGLDDIAAKKVSSLFSNQIMKNLAEFGVKASGEGLEEVLAGVSQAVGKKLTYMSEEDIGKILEDENLLEQFVVGSVTSGMIQSGYIPGTKSGSLAEANKAGTDFVSGMTQNAESVIDIETRNRISEIEASGKKLSAKEKSNIRSEVMSDFERGVVSTDSVSEALGGEAYSQYKAINDRLTEIGNELAALEKNGLRTQEEQAAYASLKADQNTLQKKADLAKKSLPDFSFEALKDPSLKHLNLNFAEEAAQTAAVENASEMVVAPEAASNDSKVKESPVADSDKKSDEISDSVLESEKNSDATDTASPSEAVSGIVSDFKNQEKAFYDEYQKKAAEIQKQADQIEASNLPEAEKAKKVKELENRLKKALTTSFSSDGFTVRRAVSDDLKRFAYMIITPDGKTRYGSASTESDSFFSSISDQLTSMLGGQTVVPVSDPDPKAVEHPLISEKRSAPERQVVDAPVESTVASESSVEPPVTTDSTDVSTTSDAPVTVNLSESGNTSSTGANRWVVSEENTQRRNKDARSVEKTDSFTVDTDPSKGKMSPIDFFKEYFLEKGSAVEKIANEHDNRELEGKYHAIRNARSAAQHLIGEGDADAGIMALKEIYNLANEAGFMTDFCEYLVHARNVDAMNLDIRFGKENRGILGNTTAAESLAEVRKYEEKYPVFKRLANELYAYNWNLLQKMVDSRQISQGQMDLMREMYPHYIPIRRVGADNANVNNDFLDSGDHVDVNRPLKSVVGGNQPIEFLFTTMANRTLAVEHAAAMNNFSLELYKTLYPEKAEMLSFETPGLSRKDAISLLESMDPAEDLISGGKTPTLGMYVDGDRLNYKISPQLYGALKPTNDLLSANLPLVSGISDFRRRAITGWNPVFGIRNTIRDAAEILKNSQHPIETYANYPKAAIELLTNGKWKQEYQKAGGGDVEIAFDPKTNSFDPQKGALDWIEGRIGLKQIIAVNNFTEQIPRLAEYMASRKDGRSIETSMLDAARVTVDFGAGGEATKFLNRNGATFLNASVQGALQHARNVREAKKNGLKGWLNLAARYLYPGATAMIVNAMLWGDDEEYERLDDYVKDNYYIVGKYGDGQFVRIPKGRTDVVMENAMNQVWDALTGDAELDFNRFFNLFLDNMAPNVVTEDNIFAPIRQVVTNKAWHGGDIVTDRLQKLPTLEQYDEKTDEISIAISEWLDEKLDYEASPKKVNYLLDQYSGVFGDLVLPYFTPKASSPSDSPVAPLLAPLRNSFTVDSVFNDGSQGEYYETLDELTEKAKTEGASTEDILLSEYMGSFNYELGDLYAKMREIQMSDLPDSEKYRRAKTYKKQINRLQGEALDGYRDILSGKGKFDIDGIYAEVGNKRFDYNEENDKWYSIGPSDNEGVNSYYEREQAVTKLFDIGYSEYWNNQDKYNAMYELMGEYSEDPKHIAYTTAVKVFGLERFEEYAREIDKLRADRDEDGNPVPNSRWNKVKPYINGLDIPKIEKKILTKMYWGEDDNGWNNYEIIRWLDNNPNISPSEFWKIAEELGYLVDEQGRITWEGK